MSSYLPINLSSFTSFLIINGWWNAPQQMPRRRYLNRPIALHWPINQSINLSIIPLIRCDPVKSTNQRKTISLVCIFTNQLSQFILPAQFYLRFRIYLRLKFRLNIGRAIGAHFYQMPFHTQRVFRAGHAAKTTSRLLALCLLILRQLEILNHRAPSPAHFGWRFCAGIHGIKSRAPRFCQIPRAKRKRGESSVI